MVMFKTLNLNYSKNLHTKKSLGLNGFTIEFYYYYHYLQHWDQTQGLKHARHTSLYLATFWPYF
jgi:hypothetical protein